MAKVHPNISDQLATWISRQPMYFLASAPLQANGHINLSPRGLDSLRVLDAQHVLMLDYVGSGNETAAHLLQNGRLTVMFCAFEGDPQILRLYGKGTVIRPEDTHWSELRAHFADMLSGVRQLFLLEVTRVQTSCGFGVPLMNLQGQRELLPQWAQKRGDDALKTYQLEKNSRSIDGLPAPGLAEKETDMFSG